MTQAQKAQGGTEYLVTMGAVLFVAMLAIGILLFAMGGTKDTKQSTLDIHAKIAAMEFPDLLQGFIGYYKFDDNGGASAADSRGGATGTLGGGNSSRVPTWTAGKSNYALEFDGADDYVDMGYSSPSFNGKQAVTLSAWINSKNAGSYQFIMARNGPFLFYLSGAKLRFAVYNGSWLWQNGSASLASNTWYHVAAVYDGSNQYIYINGSLDAKDPKSGSMSSSSCLQIGRYNGGGCDTSPGAYFNGTIDEVLIFNRALSANEIRFLYENPGYPN